MIAAVSPATGSFRSTPSLFNVLRGGAFAGAVLAGGVLAGGLSLVEVSSG